MEKSITPDSDELKAWEMESNIVFSPRTDIKVQV
jgi:hypothetical protein